MFAAQRLPDINQSGGHHSGGSPSKDLNSLNPRATISQNATATTLGMNSNSAALIHNANDLFSTKQQHIDGEQHLLRSS